MKTDQFVILVRKFDNPTMTEQPAPIGKNINSTPFSDSNDWAQLAGLWHDLGKYREKFQNHIKSVSVYDAETHIEDAPERIGHSTVD